MITQSLENKREILPLEEMKKMFIYISICYMILFSISQYFASEHYFPGEIEKTFMKSLSIHL